jgi:type II secretory ATPase GspE/PulE/Tfp pilus assembly ATPase PilB-like protein
MKTSGVRLASLFHQVGLITDADWKEQFPQGVASKKRLVDILFEDVSWQTFVDLASLEIRMPSRRRRAPSPEELTQPIAVRPAEMRDLLQRHRPNIEPLCKFIARLRPDLAEEISALLHDVKEDKTIDPHRELIERRILTPQVAYEVIQGENYPAAIRNRQLLALEILRLNGLVAPELYPKILARIDKPDFALAGALEAGRPTSEALFQAIEDGMTLPAIEISEAVIDAKCREFCPVDFLRRELFLPFEIGAIVRMASSDPLNLSLADLPAMLTGRPVVLAYAPTGEIISAINRTYPPANAVSMAAPAGREERRAEAARPDSVPAVSNSRATPRAAAANPEPARATRAKPAPPAPRQAVAQIVDTGSTVELVSSLIESAVATQATDIHIEPRNEGLRVRFRIDGQLHNVMNVPETMSLPVISRIKVMGNMNVTERRRPQDGHFALEIGDGDFDFRVSTMPSHRGEKVVLRILDQAKMLKGLGELGLSPDQEQRLAHLIARPYGLTLVTGPTGSGKTTTLYSAISKINSSQINIITIEDPVEYEIEGITQMQVDHAIELDFAGGLRAALRQDPDVILVGEIRDSETARIAIRAAMTGHLVFSTLHTNSSIGSISALFHLSITPYLISNALSGVAAQRLVKMICNQCREKTRPTPALKHDLGLADDSKVHTFRGRGCPACLNTGYSGRTGVFEILTVNDPVRRLIMDEAADEVIEDAARRDGFHLLRDDAIEKINQGITAPEEVLRVVFLND